MIRVQCDGCGRPVWRQIRRKKATCPKCKTRRDHESRKEDRVAYMKDWRATHRDHIHEYMAGWRAENKPRIHTYWRRYYRKEKKENEAVIRDLPCMDCGMKHTPETRQRILRRMLSLSITEIREAWPCVWANEREVYRDKAQIRGAA